MISCTSGQDPDDKHKSGKDPAGIDNRHETPGNPENKIFKTCLTKLKTFAQSEAFYQTLIY